MTNIDIEIHEDVISVINKLKVLDESGIELTIPIGSVLFDNVLNLKLIEKELDRYGKTVHFVTEDKFGQNLIAMMKENTRVDFSTGDIALEVSPSSEIIRKGRFRMPSFVRISSKFAGKGKLTGILIILVILGAIFGGIGYAALVTIPKANIQVIVKAQPLIKSVQIMVVKDATTSVETKTLKGYLATTTTLKEEALPTTGQKVIGESATGQIKLFNKTTTAKKIKKGHTVQLEIDDVALKYTTQEDVTVPERTEDPVTLVITPGEATVSVKATDIGPDYNIEKDETLEVDDFESSEIIAKSSSDFDGGAKETIKTVSQLDKNTLSEKLYADNKTAFEDELATKAGAGKTYIHGSIVTKINKETFDKEVDEEASEIKLSQEVTSVGLSYTERELKELLEKMLDEFIPEGYVLSSKDTELKVDVLGNSETTKVSDTQGDLQATIKAYVVTEINEDEMKDKLRGISIEEAQKYLGGIRNIEKYELSVTPNIPFLATMPRKTENITVEIVKN